MSRKPLSFPHSSKTKCMKKNKKKEGGLKKNLKYSKATRRKRDSNETRISLPEYCIKKPVFSPETISITKYPYHHNAEHHRNCIWRQHHNFNIISARTTTRTCQQSHHEATCILPHEPECLVSTN